MQTFNSLLSSFEIAEISNSQLPILIRKLAMPVSDSCSCDSSNEITDLILLSFALGIIASDIFVREHLRLNERQKALLWG